VTFLEDKGILKKHTVSIFNTEDRGRVFLQNAGIYRQVHMASEPTRITTISEISGSHGGEDDDHPDDGGSTHL
jgi:hypothetical protein